MVVVKQFGLTPNTTHQVVSRLDYRSRSVLFAELGVYVL